MPTSTHDTHLLCCLPPESAVKRRVRRSKHAPIAANSSSKALKAARAMHAEDHGEAPKGDGDGDEDDVDDERRGALHSFASARTTTTSGPADGGATATSSVDDNTGRVSSSSQSNALSLRPGPVRAASNVRVTSRFDFNPGTTHANSLAF